MLADKDIDAVWRALRRVAARVVIVPPKSARAFPARDLARQLCDRDATLACEVADDFPSALRLAAHHNDPILVTGSLFLVGEALAHLQGGARFEASAQ
jgi:dihydrofolate synthase/folylpolyglutamate synthase